MNNETHLTNLQKIIFEKGENAVSVSAEIQNIFYQEIADDVFMMPPLYSNGIKIKYMLWNYPNLKLEIKSKLEGEIISKFKAFSLRPKDPPSMETRKPKITEKILVEESKEKEVASEAADMAFPPDKMPDMEKPVSEEPTSESIIPAKVSVKAKTVKKAVAKKAASPKPTPKKTATLKSAIKKVAPKKKTAEVSTTKTSGLKKSRQTQKKTLKNDVEDLSKSMKALVDKIEKMMKIFDRIKEL